MTPLAGAGPAPSAGTAVETASEALLRATLDAVPDAVIVVGADGRIDLANRQVMPVFGYEPAELEGLPVETLVPSRSRPRHPRIRSSYTRRPMGLLQLSAVRKGGVEFAAEISLAPIPDSTSPTPRTVATVRDITERIELEREADRVREELLATVTHELRTPLTSILGYAELLDDLGPDELGPQARHLLGAVERNARREFRLVSDLLTVAVGNLSQIKLNLTEVELGGLLAEAVAEHAAGARAKSIRLLCSPHNIEANEDAGGAVITADRDRLLQVLDNLVGNAIKFTPEHGHVTVGCQLLSGSVVLTVSDDGPGIPAAEQERVFDRLYRGQSSVAAHKPGVGLGLSIVKAIVEAHRGSVTLTSSDAGTTALLQLPR